MKLIKELAGIVTENSMNTTFRPENIPSKDKSIKTLEKLLKDLVKRFVGNEEMSVKEAVKVAKSITDNVLNQIKE